MGKLHELLGVSRPTIMEILKEHEGEYGEEVENLVYCIRENLLVETASSEYLNQHPFEQGLIDGRLKDGLIAWKLITSREGVDWMARNLEPFLDYLRDRAISLQPSKRRRFFAKKKPKEP